MVQEREETKDHHLQDHKVQQEPREHKVIHQSVHKVIKGLQDLQEIHQ